MSKATDHEPTAAAPDLPTSPQQTGPSDSTVQGDQHKQKHSSPSYDLLRELTVSAVKEWIQNDRAQRRNRMLGTASVLTVFVGGLTAFLINDTLVGRVDRAVTRAIADNVAAANFQSGVAALNFNVLALDQDSVFTNQHAETIIQSIESLYATGIADDNVSPAMRFQNASDLTFAVETAAESFASADRSDLVSRLAIVAPRVADGSAFLTGILLEVTAKALIATPGGADSWTRRDGIAQREYQEYKTYVVRARTSGYPHAYLVFELITRHMEGRPDEEMRQLSAEVADLDDNHKRSFFNLLDALADGSFVNEPTVTSERIRTRTHEFLEAYGDALPLF